MRKLLIRGARTPDGQARDIAICEGRIAETVTSPDWVIDAEGLFVLPGFVDVHTHLRQPGREDAETVLTGSQAAARGGYTAVHAMANTQPVADTAGVVEQVWRLGREAGFAEVRPIGAVTTGLGGEHLAELGAMANSRAKVRIFSDDGLCVSDPLVMRRALEYVKAFDGIIAQHAQEPRLTEHAQMNEGVVSAEIGLPGWPSMAEEAIIARDVLLAQHVNSRVHICHVSTQGSVEIIRWAKSRGIKVTAEVTPHHLFLTDELVRSYDPVYKVNPPLRTEADVEALREALADGTIDIIGTDHAPHPGEHKSCEWTAAAMGMVGLETAFSVVTTAMEDYDFTIADIARVMSTAPAQIAGLTHHGTLLSRDSRLAIGAPANLTLVDPAATTYVIPETHATKARNNPFAGLELTGTVVHTVFYGHQTVTEGNITEGHPEVSTWIR